MTAEHDIGSNPAPPALELQVDAAHAGVRLDEYLAREVPGLSRRYLARALATGAVQLNHGPAQPGIRLATGDVVSARLDLGAATAMTPEALPFEVLYEDGCLAVVVKPAGMVTHPAGRHRSGTLANALSHRFNVLQAADPPVRPGIVHRLDRDTSGLLVVAREQRALRELTIAFQQGRVEKRYLALVRGCPTGNSGRWEAPIGCDRSAFPRWGIREGGRPAVTLWRLLEALPEAALLELVPVTGRTNQLRLHGAHFGHPILGDTLFGGPTALELPGAGGAPRLCLHAEHLAFAHPYTGEPLAFRNPLPAELARYLAAARSAASAAGVAAG